MRICSGGNHKTIYLVTLFAGFESVAVEPEPLGHSFILRGGMMRRLFVALVVVLFFTPAVAIEFQSFDLQRQKFKPLRKPPKITQSAKAVFKVKFFAKGELTLGAGNDGIDLATDDVRVSVGEFVQEIPAGSFDVRPSGTVKFKSKDLNSLRRVLLKPTGPDSYKFLIKGTRLAMNRPTLLTLQIGDDVGQINLITETAQTPLAFVHGRIIAGAPPFGIGGVSLEFPCPSGTCTAVTTGSGEFFVESQAGSQDYVVDGTSSPSATYPRLRNHAVVEAGTTELGPMALPALDVSNGVFVSAGVQGAATNISSNPIGGGVVSVTIPSGATVTFPPGLSSPQVVSISQVPVAVLPMPFPAAAASELVFTAQPGATTISPCGDVTLPATEGGLSDGTLLDIYGFDHTVGDFVSIGQGTVQNGGTEIFAAGVLCEFSWAFASCNNLPVNTDLTGLVTYNGLPVSGVRLFSQGLLTSSTAETNHASPPSCPPTCPHNFLFQNEIAGCAGEPLGVGVVAEINLGPSGILQGASGFVPAVQSGLTDLGPIPMSLIPCGGFLTQWGGLGAAPGLFLPDPNPSMSLTTSGPGGVATDGAGSVWVADPGNHRIQKFDSNGVLDASWGANADGTTGVLGNSTLEFESPADVAYSSANGGEIYVADRINGRIVVFDAATGTTQRTSWSTGSTNPTGVAVFDVGPTSARVYVGSFVNGVLKFDESGTAGIPASFGGSLAAFGIAVDSAENIYVGLGTDVVKFDSAGTVLIPSFLTLGLPSGGNFKFGNGITGLAADAATVFAADVSSRVTRFDPTTGFLVQFGLPGVAIGQFGELQGIATDTSGNIFLSDSTNSVIHKVSCP